MTPAFLGIVGRTADITLVVFLLMQSALAFRMSQTVALHLCYRRSGLERERIALTQPLPAEDELPAVLIQIPTYNEGYLVRRALEAAVSLDWPRDRLQIQLLDDSTDASAEIALATVAEFRRQGPASKPGR
jgi:cellulose synthase/poly-beta-1,6-N-acetylglucosamine synthase-like glycosyltransferase